MSFLKIFKKKIVENKNKNNKKIIKKEEKFLLMNKNVKYIQQKTKKKKYVMSSTTGKSKKKLLPPRIEKKHKHQIGISEICPDAKIPIVKKLRDNLIGLQCEKVSKTAYELEVTTGEINYVDGINEISAVILEMKRQVMILWRKLDEYDQSAIACGIQVLIREKKISELTFNKSCTQLLDDIKVVLDILNQDFKMCYLKLEGHIHHQPKDWWYLKSELAKKGC